MTKAEIHVGNIIVEGKSEGNITCEDKIELRSTAKIFGDITATRLTIAEGVNIIGKCSVSTEKPSPDTFKQERHGLQDFKKPKEEKPQIEKIGIGSSVTTK
jgi:cytoskeletal protein CcmA (bactofilin family)